MKKFNKQNFVRILFTIHRDLGLFVVGLCFIYGISGLLLNTMDGSDPAYNTLQDKITITSGLGEDELKTEWIDNLDLPAVKKVKTLKDNQIKITCEGGYGLYQISDGSLSYEIYQKRPLIFWINKMHYNRIHGWNIMGNIFAISLVFFAISGLFMVRGKNGIAGRGKWFLISGFIIPVLYIFFT